MHTLWSWESIKEAIANSYDDLDGESMADLAAVLIGGEWDYDAESETFTQTKDE